MTDFSQSLAKHTDTILTEWIVAVRRDRQIDSGNDLPDTAIRDSIPVVLHAMTTTLSQPQDSEIQALVAASLEHGTLRAAQGFEPKEIAHEYHLLHEVIFSVLEADLLAGSVAEVLRVVRLIERMLHEALSRCFNSYTEERLRELDQLQSQLTLNNQELTRLVRTNKEHLSHLAHELKTPLTSIIGYSDLFLRQQRQHPEVTDTLANLGHIERVLRNGRQLLRLINDVLEISRYEAGRMHLQVTPTDVRALIKSVVEVLEPLAQSKELQIDLECDRAPNWVLTDAFRLQQVVTNLLSNAIRYTEVGSVQLQCQVLSKDQWSIAIIDTGIGISPQDQSRVFEPFFQASSPNHPPRPDSTGLGLAIVTQLVKILQGRIELVSQVGVGSTFTVTLPLEIKLEEFSPVG
jgi:signal transduction histidine kinase